MTTTLRNAPNGSARSRWLAIAVLGIACAVPATRAAGAPPPAMEGRIWSGGLVRYYFEDEVGTASRLAIERAMAEWQTATRLLAGEPVIRFERCDEYAAANATDAGTRRLLEAACEQDVEGTLKVRNNVSGKYDSCADYAEAQTDNPELRRFHEQACETDPVNILRQVPTTEAGSYGCGRPSAKTPAGTDETDRVRLRLPAGGTSLVKLRHELGHCLGLAHEHQRSDRDDYVAFVPDTHAEDWDMGFLGDANWATRDQPLVGNFDYGSIMIYDSRDGVDYGPPCTGGGRVRFTDLHENRVCKSLISDLDASRLLQMYAPREWDGFRALNGRDGERPRKPDIKRGVAVVGSPAIARLDDRRSLVVARGADDALYAAVVAKGTTPVTATWTRMGCCAGSDPSAVARGGGAVDVAFVGRDSGRILATAYRDGRWSGWTYVGGTVPGGGVLAATIDGKRRFAGPALAAWDLDRRDVFVAGADTRLYHAVEERGRSWTAWKPVDGSGGMRWAPGAAYTRKDRLFVAIDTGSILVRQLEGGRWEPSWWDKGGRPGERTAPVVTSRRGGWYRLFFADHRGRLATYPALPEFAWRLAGGLLDPYSSPAVHADAEDGFRMAIHGPPLVNAAGVEFEDGGLWVRDVAPRP